MPIEFYLALQWVAGIITTVFAVVVAYQKIKGHRQKRVVTKMPDNKRYVEHPIQLHHLPSEVTEALKQANEIKIALAVIKNDIDHLTGTSIKHLENDVNAMFHRMDKITDLLIEYNSKAGK
jgi:hypothetical protein